MVPDATSSPRMEIGIYTFGDRSPHHDTGGAPGFRERLEQIVDWARLADDVGLDVFAVGEHHRLDMAVSAPEVVLAAAARETDRIKLSSATTVLNTADPVRVYEAFATLDLLSGGRAEVIAGRGSFTESFHLFGVDMDDYDALFAEHLDLLLECIEHERVTWEGTHRSSLEDAEVAPRAMGDLPVWVGVGGTPGSAARAGRLGLPLNLAILSGPQRFPPLVEHHRQGARQAGHDPGDLPVAVSCHGYVADDGDAARDRHYGVHSAFWKRGLRNRFPPREVTREQYAQEAGPRGAMMVGDAEDVVEKILWERELLGHERTLLQLDWGGVPPEEVTRAIEILGTEVKPAVEDRLADDG